MKIKSIVLSILATGLISNFALAGGDHTKSQHAHSKMDHSKMQSMKHDEKHQHNKEGSSVGQPALASSATKTINVTTEDVMRFNFASMPDLKNGDIVKFIIKNNGQMAHEFSIGDEKEQQAHREMMRKMPGMVHQDGNTVTIQPGDTKELVWKFKQGNEVVFACNISGHFEAGMVARAIVSTTH